MPRHPAGQENIKFSMQLTYEMLILEYSCQIVCWLDPSVQTN
jgi:hypothetical protein